MTTVEANNDRPSNILVSVQSEKPVLKIIDFGVAKAITPPLTDRARYTEQGQFVGTPEYISPELAAIALSPDVRSRLLQRTRGYIRSGGRPWIPLIMRFLASIVSATGKCSECLSVKSAI